MWHADRHSDILTHWFVGDLQSSKMSLYSISKQNQNYLHISKNENENQINSSFINYLYLMVLHKNILKKDILKQNWYDSERIDRLI